MKLSHIIEGWGMSMGLLEIKPADRKRSEERMKVCAACPFAKESSFLKLLKGAAHNMAAIQCTKCSCPVNEKSLVKNETCPEGKWK